MTLIELLTAYEEASVGLSPSEQVVYLRATLIWNRCHRPEWVAISRTELMRATGIASKNTIDAAREQLEEKGFISTIPQGRTQPRKWQFRALPTRSTIDLEEETRPMNDLTRPMNDLPTRPMNDLAEDKNNPTRSTIDPHWVNEWAKLGQSLTPSQRERESSSCSNTPTTCSTNSIDSNEPERETPDVPKEVMDAYQDEIRPVTSAYELERLADDVDHYGKETVIKAIHIATMNNKRFLGYIEGVLKRWETEGYDEEGGKNAGSSRNYRATDEDDLDRWAAELTEGL